MNAEVFVTASITASEARAKLHRLIDETAESHRPVWISGRRGDAVLIAAEDWQASQETLCLLANPWHSRIDQGGDDRASASERNGARLVSDDSGSVVYAKSALKEAKSLQRPA